MKCFYFLHHKKENSERDRSNQWAASADRRLEQKQPRPVLENSPSTSELRPPYYTQTVTASETSCSTSSASDLPSTGLKLHELHNFKLTELKAATRNFNVRNFLGEGGFGSVYRGWIKQKDSDGKETKSEVAVKRLNTRSHQGPKEWICEVKYLGLVDHPNLVKLIGYCVEDDAKGIQLLLVYEYVANKSLEAHLFGNIEPALAWETRLRIALGAARGLVYLHQGLDIQIIYRDFKSSNILLDNNFTPKLSDFGFAREGPDIGATHVTTEVVGTMGYAAPEYVRTGHLTSKSDVWSFGIVLLELLTGRRALNNKLPKDDQWLLNWVKPYVRNWRKIDKIVDPRLAENYPLPEAQKLFTLACQCVVKNPKSRPAMGDVVKGLKQIMEPPSSEDTIKNHETRAEDLQEKDSPSLNPRERYLLLKEEVNFKMKERGHPHWNKLSKPNMVRTS